MTIIEDLRYFFTYVLMPSDKATDLISLLIDIISPYDVPFHQPQQLQCLHNGQVLPLYPFVPHSFFITGDLW